MISFGEFAMCMTSNVSFFLFQTDDDRSGAAESQDSSTPHPDISGIANKKPKDLCSGPSFMIT
ncbi:hypothetical protein PLACP1_14950 [Planifilum fimeticola]